MIFIRRHILPWVKVLVCQALGLSLMLLFSDLVPTAGPLRLLVQGALAAGFGWTVGLSAVWLPIQILLPLAAVYSDALPAWGYLVTFLAFALVYWNSASGQVPLYLTNRRTFEALSEIAARHQVRSFVDLGSGLGGVVLFLARHHPEMKTRGIENAPLVILASQGRRLISRLGNAQMVWRSIWDEDLSAYDMVYCFLSPVPMPRIYEKARREMRPGTLFVSNSFAVPGIEPEIIVDVADGRRTRLYLYRI